jgi:coenzyme PQQ synthesis protein D (PqqD)
MPIKRSVRPVTRDERQRRRWIVFVLALLALGTGCNQSPSTSARQATDKDFAGPARASNYFPRRHPDAAFREIGDEGGVVVLPGRKEVKVLNPVGSRAYSLMDGKHTTEDIARVVTDEFDVDYATALKDVRAFLEEMRETEGMLAPDEVGVTTR